MNTVRFNRDHQWVRAEGGDAIVGITDYAQAQLGDIVHVDLRQVGSRIRRGQEVAAVESVKVANGLEVPLAGEVVAINLAIADQPSQVNADPMGEGWFYKVRVEDRAALDALLDIAAYGTFVETLTAP